MARRPVCSKHCRSSNRRLRMRASRSSAAGVKVRQIAMDGVRFSHAEWMPDGRSVALVHDAARPLLPDEVIEILPETRQYHTVQYFQRARFEWHGENQPKYRVQLGLLESRDGAETWQPVAKGIRGRWWNAGHILGSASVVL